MRGTVVAIALALAASLVPAAAQADHGGATVPWTSLLPAQWGAGQAGRNPSGCGTDGLPCVRDVERRLARLAAVFFDMYRDALAAHEAGQPLPTAWAVALGLRMPDGRSRKPDHDRVNVVLSRAYDRIVPAIAERYDPFMTTADARPSPVDDIAAQNMVAGWRENVAQRGAADHRALAT